MSDECHLPDYDEPAPELDAPRLVDPRTLPARVSHLKAAGVSGAHCLYAFQGDNSETLARRLGSGTHALLLGKPCALWEQPSQAWIKAREKALAAGRESPPMSLAPRSGGLWVAFQAKHPGAVILTRKEMDAAERMRDALVANGNAARLIHAADAIYEETIIWSQLGRARRSTPDIRCAGGADGRSFVAEIKTTRCAAPFPFGRDAKKLGYHAQLADQAAAIQYHTGKAPRTAYIIAVESARPHVVQVYEVPDAILEQGAQLCNMWLERLQMYEATGLWSGYSPRVETLEFFEFNALPPPTAPPEFESAD